MPIDFSKQQRHERTAEVCDRVTAYLSQHEYSYLETDIIQPADLFLTRAGDQIITRLFTFERRAQLHALRPEFTAIAAHSYATGFAHLSPLPVVRWQFQGPVFEESIDHHGVTQFTNIGAELIGTTEIQADAEIIRLAVNGIAEAGVADTVIVLGHVGLMRAAVSQFGLDSRTVRFLLTRIDDLADPSLGVASVIEQLDRLLGTANHPVDHDDEDATVTSSVEPIGVAFDTPPLIGLRSQADVQRRLAQKRKRAAERDRVIEALRFLDHWARIDLPIEAAVEQVRELVPQPSPTITALIADLLTLESALAASGIRSDRIRLRPGLERSWDYYTGVVFEVRTTDGVLVAGGGRYDELVRLLGGGVDVPAVGFAVYADDVGQILLRRKRN